MKTLLIIFVIICFVVLPNLFHDFWCHYHLDDMDNKQKDANSRQCCWPRFKPPCELLRASVRKFSAIHLITTFYRHRLFCVNVVLRPICSATFHLKMFKTSTKMLIVETKDFAATQIFTWNQFGKIQSSKLKDSPKLSWNHIAMYNPWNQISWSSVNVFTKYFQLIVKFPLFHTVRKMIIIQ